MNEQNKVEVLFSGNAAALERAQGKLNRWPKEYSDQLRQLGQAYQELGRQHDATIKRLEQQRGPGASGHFGTWQKIQQQAQAEDAARRQTLATQVWDTTLRGQRAAGHEQQMDALKTFFASIQSGAGTMARWAGAMAGIDTSMMGLGAVVQAVTAEFDALERRMTASRQAQLGEAQSLQGFLSSAGADLGMTMPQIEAWRTQMRRRGFLMAEVDAVAGAAAGSRPQDTTIRGALEATQATMGLFPRAPLEEKKDLAMAVERIRGAYGGTAEQAVGFMLSAHGQSQLREQHSWTRYGPQAMAGLKQMFPEMTEDEAAHFYNTMGQIMNDPRGQSSRSSVLRWGWQMRKAMRDQPQLKTPMQILEFLQTDPSGPARIKALIGEAGSGEDVIAEMLGPLRAGRIINEVDALDIQAMSGEATWLPAWEQLFQTPVAELKRTQKKIPPLPEAEGKLTESLGSQAMSTFNRMANIDMALGGASQQAIAEDDRNALMGTIMARFSELADQDESLWAPRRYLNKKALQASLAATATKDLPRAAATMYELQATRARMAGYPDKASAWQTGADNLEAQQLKNDQLLHKGINGGVPGRGGFLQGAPKEAPAAPGVNDQGAVELQKQTGLLAQMVSLLAGLPEALSSGGGVGPGPPIASGPAAMG